MEYLELNNKLDQLSDEISHVKAEQACLAHLANNDQRNFQSSLETFQKQSANILKRLSAIEASHKRGAVKSFLAGEENLELKNHLNTFIRRGSVADQSMEVKELSTESGGNGLIPQYMSDQIVHLLNKGQSLRSLCSIIQIEGDSVDLLVEKTEPDAGWVGEKDSRAETTAPGVMKLTIATHELYAKPKVTQKILDDSLIDVEQWVVNKIVQQMIEKENQAFLTGTGKKMPRGILTYPFKEGSNTWGEFQSFTLDYKKMKDSTEVSNLLTDMLYSLNPVHLDGALWLMSRQTLSMIRKLKEEHSGRFLWQPSLMADQPSTLLGYPVIVTDHMPKMANEKISTQILFGNFKNTYQVVDRTTFSILRDPYSSKPFVEFYITRRVGGDVMRFDGLKGLQISNNG